MEKLNEAVEGIPTLSVIIPVFNAEQYLEKCLNSVVSQTFRDIEIIVVDDGSTDGSLQICNAYAQRDGRIIVISKENGGSIRARKTGLSVAQGEIIGFVDSDDWIEQEMYEELVKCMGEMGCDLVSSGISRDYQDSGRSEILFDRYEEGLYENLTFNIYPSMLFDERYKYFGLYCNLVSKIYRKTLLDKVYKDINEDVFFGEDALACYPYCLLCDSIYIMHKAFYHYNIRGGSMCSTPDSRLLQNNYLLYKGLQDVFRNTECSFVLMRQLKRYMIRLEKHSLMMLYHINATAWDIWKFSYDDDLFQKKFVIYGAGGCGQALYRLVCEKGMERNIAYWVDKRANERMEECCYPIQFPDVLNHTDWEILFVAVENEALARKIAEEIQRVYGVEEDRMYWSRVDHKWN